MSNLNSLGDEHLDIHLLTIRACSPGMQFNIVKLVYY